MNTECKIKSDEGFDFFAGEEMKCFVLDADDEWIKIRFKDKVDDKILPIIQLSAGYQSLVWMAFYIEYQMAVLNPDKNNVQFIAATHSPILFAATDKLWLIDVEEDEVHYSESRCGYNADAFEDRREGVEEILRPFFVKGVSFFLCIS